MNSQKIILAFVTAIAFSNSSAFSQVPVAPVPVAVPATPTLWSFLGIPQGVKKVRGALTNRRGNLPGLEPKDAMRALNDPRNLLSEDLAIKKAAELKIKEDLKPQKIKALKYLASIGCGCYDKDGKVTEALIAAAEDCTEDVRLTVMEEIKGAASNKCCSNCGQVCCCNEKMLKKLAEVAYERDDEGCYKEPSARVRQAAAEALRACLPNSEPPCIAPEEPQEPDAKVDTTPDPEKKPVPEKTKASPSRPVPERQSNDLIEPANGTEEIDAKKEPERLNESLKNEVQDEVSGKFNGGIDTQYSSRRQFQTTEIESQRSSRRRFQTEYTDIGSQLPTQASVSMPEQNVKTDLEHAFQPKLNAELDKLADNEGVIISYDEATNVAHVHFTNRSANLCVGDKISFQANPTSDELITGNWLIVYAERGCIRMEALDASSMQSVKSGQHMILAMEPVLNSVSPVSYQKP